MRDPTLNYERAESDSALSFFIFKVLFDSVFQSVFCSFVGILNGYFSADSF